MISFYAHKKNSFLFRRSPFFLLLHACLFIAGCTNKDTSSRFTKLPASATGINFINKNEDSDTLNILDYLYYYNGGGVAIGDINNDGLPDICFSSNQEGNRLYLNKGNWKFEDITESSGIKGRADWTTGITMADVNGDGLLDIYVCAVSNHKPQNMGVQNSHTYFTHSKNQLFINKGNLHFAEEAAKYGLDVEGYNTQAAFFDYDKDGDLDMFLLQHSIHQTSNYGDTSARNRYSTISGGKLFRNDNNFFTDVTPGSGIISSTLGYGLGAGVADLNQDGYDDIYVSNDFHENDYYYLNEKNGHFKEINRSAFGHESKFSMGNDIADINNDGWPDILTLDMLPADEKVLKSSVGDESYDNYQLKIGLGFHYQYGRNCLQLNTGGGFRFSDIALFSGVAATDWSWSPLIADFNLDGNNDIFISNGIKNRLNDLDYIKFLSGQQSALPNNSRAGDKEMLKHQPPGKWHNYFFAGSPGLKFGDSSAAWGFGEPTLSQGAAYADLDGDGAPDLVTNNLNEDAGVYRNNIRNQAGHNYLSVDLRFRRPNYFSTGAKIIAFAGGRLMYRELQPERGFQSSSEPVLHLGLGTNPFVDSLFIIWPDNTFLRLTHVEANQKLRVDWDRKLTDTIIRYSEWIRDLLGNPKHDLFETAAEHGLAFTQEIIPGNTDFNRQPFIPHAISDAGPKSAVADVNGDGLDDIFICGGIHQPGKLFVQNKDGSFSERNQSLFAADSSMPKANAIFFDANQDGAPDLYVVAGGGIPGIPPDAWTDRLYLNDGKGNFTRSKTLPVFSGDKSVVCAADLDGDGRQDLFIGGRSNPFFYGDIPASYLLHNDGNAHFSLMTDAVLPGLNKLGMITGACFTDLDGDHRPDLVLVGEWQPVRIFMNRNGKFTQADAGIGQMTGWWNCVQSTDINGDGYADLILGNLGLNSKLHASREFPLKIYVGDFDQNGTPEQLLAIEKQGKYYPFLGKEDLEKKLPYLKKEFLGYGKMAGKTIDEIFGDRLKKAQVFEINTLQSVALLNDGKGNFLKMDLPDEMQWAPVFSFATADFDGDGKTDLLAGGNFFGVIPFEGRYDAMPLVFGKGTGNGHFQSSIQTEETLLIDGEIRDLKIITVKGKKELVILRHHQPLLTVTYQRIGK